MAKQPVSGHDILSDHLQTWILRVYIHCEGCKKKVFKVLQSIDGVYKTVIDAKDHKVTVTGSVNGEALVQKLHKSGKHAEILPESFAVAAAADNASGNSKKKKKKQSNKQNDDVTEDNAEHIDDGEDGSKGVTTDGSDGGNGQQEADPPVNGGDGNDNGTGGGKNKKKKKNKKGEKNTSNGPPNGDTEGLPTVNPTAENVGASMEKLNLGPPIPQMVYSTPYDLPPYQSYYPTPAYGMSYNTSYPGAESSYYTPPVYGYAQSHPSVFYPLPPPSANYRRSAFDDNDDEGGDGRWCTIM